MVQFVVLSTNTAINHYYSFEEISAFNNGSYKILNYIISYKLSI